MKIGTMTTRKRKKKRAIGSSVEGGRGEARRDKGKEILASVVLASVVLAVSFP